MNRRGLVSGLGALFVCAPAIVRISSLMPLSIQPRNISFDLIPPDMLVPMGSWEDCIEVEVDPLDPKRINVLMPREYVEQLRIVARLVETHLELPYGRSI